MNNREKLIEDFKTLNNPITKDMFDKIFPIGYIIPYSKFKMPFGKWKVLKIDNIFGKTKFKIRDS